MALTCVSPGEGAGLGTEVGPVIGCGGLFISRSFTVLHQGGVVLPTFLRKGGKTREQLIDQKQPKTSKIKDISLKYLH